MEPLLRCRFYFVRRGIQNSRQRVHRYRQKDTDRRRGTELRSVAPVTRKGHSTSIRSLSQKLTRGEMAEMIWRLKTDTATRHRQALPTIAKEINLLAQSKRGSLCGLPL